MKNFKSLPMLFFENSAMYYLYSETSNGELYHWYNHEFEDGCLCIALSNDDLVQLMSEVQSVLIRSDEPYEEAYNHGLSIIEESDKRHIDTAKELRIVKNICIVDPITQIVIVEDVFYPECGRGCKIYRNSNALTPEKWLEAYYVNWVCARYALSEETVKEMLADGVTKNRFAIEYPTKGGKK